MTDSTPTTDVDQAVPKFPTALTVFGSFNLLVAIETAVFGVVLPTADRYEVWPEYSPSRALYALISAGQAGEEAKTTYIDTLFATEFTVRFLGIGLLAAAGVGLLLKKPWGRSLSIGWAIAIMAAYILMGIAGARPFFVPVAYPFALLCGMYLTSAGATSRPTREHQTETVPSSTRPEFRFRSACCHLVTAVTVLSIVLAVVVWWGRHPIERPIEREMFKLKYGNELVRKSACDRLGTIGPEAAEAVPALIEEMDKNISSSSAPEEGWDHQGWAARALLKIRTVPALSAVLGNKTYREDAELAFAALLRTGELEDVPKQTDLYPASLSFSGLWFTDAEAEDLKGWTRLAELRLKNTGVTDAGLKHLKGLTNLRLLALGNTRITDAGLEHLRGLTKLRVLGLGNTQITDAGLIHLKGLTNLNALDLSGNQITDITPVAALVELRTLHLVSNQIVELAPLSNLGNLRELRLGGNKIKELSPLKGLTNLTVLTLQDNQIRDIGPLRDLRHLQWLDLGARRWISVASQGETRHAVGGNKIVNIQPLSNLQQLRFLSLGNNEIRDISSLAHLTGIGQGSVVVRYPIDEVYEVRSGVGIDLRGNPLNDQARGRHIPALRSLGTKVLVDPKP